MRTVPSAFRSAGTPPVSTEEVLLNIAQETPLLCGFVHVEETPPATSTDLAET